MLCMRVHREDKLISVDSTQLQPYMRRAMLQVNPIIKLENIYIQFPCVECQVGMCAWGM